MSIPTAAAQTPARTGSTESGALFDQSCAAMASNGTDLLARCGLNDNFLTASIQPFMTLTGGYLPLLFWGVLALVIYLKYRNYLYSSIFAVVTLVGTGIWLPVEGQVYLYLALATGLAAAIFTLIWRIPRDVG